MKLMFKMITAALFFTALFCFSACGEKQSGGDTGTKANETNAETNIEALDTTSSSSAAVTTSAQAVTEQETDTAEKLSPLYTAKVYGVNFNDEYIVANVNVKDEPYGAKGDGVTDDTSAIQKALNTVSEGGIVYIPAGIYMVKGTLSIPDQCTLTGDWHLPDGKREGETVLLAYAGRGSGEGTPFISMGTASSIIGISVYYPEQKPDALEPYPYTVGFGAVSCYINGMTLYNSYNGVNTHLVNGSAQHVFNMYGTPLANGVSFDIDLEVTELACVRFGIDIWADSGFDGAPVSDTDKAAVRELTKSAKAVMCGRNDDIFMWDININPDDYATGLYFYVSERHPTPALQGGSYGHLIKLHDTAVTVDGMSTFGVVLDFVDKTLDQNTLNYSLSTGRRTEESNILSIMQIPYSAVGDGVADDTDALKRCIDDIKSMGGGIVFIPAGKFKITESITVPTGVELRGVMTGPNTAFHKQCSQLDVYADKNGGAAISLEPSSGINGVVFYYPENKLAELTELPYTVRGLGNNVWIKSVVFINSYDAVDFATNKCDSFFIGNTWGTAMNFGVYVGGGSSGGIIENTLFTYGEWQEVMALYNDPDLPAMTRQHTKNAIPYVFEDCRDITGWSVFAFGSSIGAVFRENNGSMPENIVMYRLGLDTPNCKSSLRLDNAGNINIYGLSTASNRGPGIYETGELSGTVSIYGHNRWGGCVDKFKNPSKIVVYNAE